MKEENDILQNLPQSFLLTDPNSFNIFGVREADRGNYRKALKYFNRAIQEDPNNAISYFNRASIKMTLGDVDGAIVDFRLSEQFEEIN